MLRQAEVKCRLNDPIALSASFDGNDFSCEIVS